MKAELRKKYRALRKTNHVSPDHFIRNLSKLVEKCSTIALYMHILDEVNLESFINELFSSKQVYLPVIENKKMFFRNVTHLNQCVPDDAGILAPVDGRFIAVDHLDAIVMSCVAANQAGYRLGYGGGYYDQELQNYTGLKIGIVYENCITDIDFQNEKDIHLDYLVTEKRIIETNRA